MSNSSKFIQAHERIHEYLRVKSDPSAFKSFKDLLYEFENDVVVKRYSHFLWKYANLRNAITHDGTGAIAEPHSDVVTHIIAIADKITSPPPVIPNLKTKVESYSPDDIIGKVILQMKGHSYSQVPVIKNNGVVTGLLTSDTIVRWLAHSFDKVGLADLEKTTLSEVLEHYDRKSPPVFIVLENAASLFDVLDAFEKSTLSGQRLDAVLITDTGKKGDLLLGIVTVWDIPRIIDLVKLTPR